jgi:predicted nucleic acid-binding Zn ribbon protein
LMLHIVKDIINNRRMLRIGFYPSRGLSEAGMSERIAQHHHCRQCGKAFVGDEPFCSEGCKAAHNNNLKKKKKQLTLLYVITFVILILALIFVSL